MSNFADPIDKITISKFSAITKLTPKALRLYDKRELLTPSIKDPFNNYRYYTLDQVEVGIKVNMLKKLGFGIDEIKIILNAASIGDDTQLHTLFTSRLQNIQIEVERLKKIEQLIKDKKPMELLYMQCTEPDLKNIPEMRVITKRKSGTYENTIEVLINEIMAEIFSIENQKSGVKMVGPIMFISHDQEFKTENADIEVALPISGRIIIQSPEIELKNLNPTSVISVIFTGPYHDVGIGYSKAHEYAISNQYRTYGQSREIYLNDPNKVPSDQLLTEIQIPVEVDN